MIYQPPFEPTIVEAEAILNIGYMFADFLIILLFLILIIYIYKKMDTKYDFLSIIIVYLFSVVISIEALSHVHTHFSPMLEIFFLLFQTSIFVIYSLKFYERKKR